MESKKKSGPIWGLYQWTMNWSQHPQATKALSTLSFLEASVFPLPVDPLLLAMGFSKPKKSLYYAFLTTFFSVLGAMGGYLIGLFMWSTFSPFFFHSIFNEASFDTVTHQMKTQEGTFISLFVAGFSPLPFKIFTISAGVIKAPLIPFIMASLLSRGLRFFILGGLVYKLGFKARTLVETHFEKLTIIVSVVLVLTLIGLKFIL